MLGRELFVVDSERVGESKYLARFECEPSSLFFIADSIELYPISEAVQPSI